MHRTSRHRDLKQVRQIGVGKRRFDIGSEIRTRKVDLCSDDLRWPKHAGRERDVELLVLCPAGESDCSRPTAVDRHIASLAIKRDLISRQILVRKISSDVCAEVCDTRNRREPSSVCQRSQARQIDALGLALEVEYLALRVE